MQLNKEQILSKLHHRLPYMQLDEVIEASDQYLHARKTLTNDEFYFACHFPDAPVLPGAIMQEMNTQAAGLLITLFHSPVENYHSQKTKGHALGVLSKVNHAKYKGFAKPGDILDIKVQLYEKLQQRFYFKGHILNNDQKIMLIDFVLINTSDQSLQ